MTNRQKRLIEKEYRENNIKITRYAEVKQKDIYIKGKPRKPVFGPK